MGKTLRAIVLDNDEATGSYNILFGLWEVLRETSFGKLLSLEVVLDYLIDVVVKEPYNIFRPHLFTFLHTAYELREKGHIDSIIMYTNQEASFTWRDCSIPVLISILMTRLMNKKERPLFDHILSRPPENYQREVGGGWILKSFDRILNLYPGVNRDIRDIVFVDDNANPKLIEADNITAEHKTLSSWQHVSPYRVLYNGKQLRTLVDGLAKYYGYELTRSDLDVLNTIALEQNEKETATYSPNDPTFTDLKTHVLRHFLIKKGGRSHLGRIIRRKAGAEY
jgi:hypothetical protein